jgi:4-amino-4-deoxy-L-arabinose transferase-like glycosyltransferase
LAAQAAGLLLLALALRAASLAGQGFDGLYGQDPYAYYQYAVGPAREALLHLQPLPPFFWPPGYPLLIAIGTFLAGRSPLVGQAISLLAGSLIPVLTFALARELSLDLDSGAAPGGRLPAWAPGLAGFVAAVHPQLWQSSTVVMSDTTALAAATLGAWALARYARLDRARWLALSAATLAYAIATRWAFALMAVPCAVYGLYLLVRRARGHWAAAAVQAAGATLAGGVVLAALLGPGLLGRSPTGTAGFTGDLEVYTWSPLNFARREFVTVDGRLSYRLPNGVYYALSAAHPYYFTPLLAPLLLPGSWRVLRRRRVRAWVLLLAWPIMILGFHAGAPWQNFRFTLAALPPLAVLLAFGAAQVAAWLRPRVRWLLPVVVVPGLAWMAVGGWQLPRQFIERKQADLALVAAVEAQAPLHARLLTFSLTQTFVTYSRLETYELWALDRTQLANLAAEKRPMLLLIDVGNVESQWLGRSPSDNYHWLRDGPGLDELGRYGNYTLFKVK